MVDTELLLSLINRNAFFDQGRVALGQERRFVHVPADGMSKAVAEGVEKVRIF